MEPSKKYRISVEDITIQQKKTDASVTYPLLQVHLASDIGVADIRDLVLTLKKVTVNLPQIYFSVTDIRDIHINHVLQKFVLTGMEKSYNSFLHIKNQAEISFVLINKNNQSSDYLIEKLETINGEAEEKYAYHYQFITDESEILPIITHYLKASKNTR